MQLTNKHKKKVIVAAVVVAITLGAYSLYIYQSTLYARLFPAKANAKDVEQTLSKVSKLIELPQNEAPEIAVISDINKLKDQTFFANAQNGDKVIMYIKTKKAFIYRPTTNKLIEVGPINITGTQQNPQERSSSQGATFVLPSGTPKP